MFNVLHRDDELCPQAINFNCINQLGKKNEDRENLDSPFEKKMKT